MVMVFVSDLFDLREIDQFREIVKVEHRLVVAMLAIERHVFAEVHIFQMIGDKTAVTPLDPFGKNIRDVCRVVHLFYNTAFRTFDKSGQEVHFLTVRDLGPDLLDGLARIQL